MLKLFFVIFANFHRAPYIVPKMRYMADHPQKYSEAERYDMMRHCIDLMNKSGKITTEAYGLENLPEINEVAKDVKNGKRYVLFPEGGYKFNNKNKVQDFKAGSFKIALKSHVPIIPIALIDSYKVFNSFHFGPVTTQVHYLKPIEYDEYKDMKTRDMAALVKERIEEKIKEILG